MEMTGAATQTPDALEYGRVPGPAVVLLLFFFLSSSAVVVVSLDESWPAKSLI